MAKYRFEGPDGKTHLFEGPSGLSQQDIDLLAGRYLNIDRPETRVRPEQPQGEMGFIPSVKRGALGLESLLADVAPAMVAKGLGFDQYAARQMEEAAATQKEIQEKYPAEVASYKDIDSVGKALTYVKEAIGEAIPSMLPSIFTGGVAGVASKGAQAAAMQAAEQVAKRELMKDAAQAAIKSGAYGAQKETLDAVRRVALEAGLEAAKKTALKYEAAGALAGSAAQNIPDVYQNVYEAGGTGQADLLPALVGGAFNAVLDAITPLNILRKARKAGIPESEIIGAWYKRAGKGAVEGFVTEGGTEAIQEMSSAAAENFVNANKQFFTPENFSRFIDAGLKGGFGGAGITAGTNVLFGQAAPEQKKGITPAAPPALPQLTPEQQKLIEQGAPAPMADQTFEIAPEVTPPVNVEGLMDEIAALKEDNAARGAKLQEALENDDTNTAEFQNRKAKYDRIQKQIEEKEAQLNAATTTTAAGETNVGQPIATTSGTSPEVLEQPSVGGPAAGGIDTSPTAGMVPAGTDVTGTAERTAGAPPTVNQLAREEEEVTSEEPGPSSPVSFEGGEYRKPAYAWPKAEEEVPATEEPAAGTDEEIGPRPSTSDIRTGMKFDEATVGNLYDEERTLPTATDTGERVQLPEWSKLTRDQKDLYLGYITNNTGEEHDRARQALVNYREELREANRQDAQPELDALQVVDPKEFQSEEAYQEAEKARADKLARLRRRISDIKANPAAAAYIFNRKAQEQKEEWKFPEWIDLTPGERAQFKRELVRRLRDRYGKDKPVDMTLLTGEDIDAAFHALGKIFVRRAVRKELKRQLLQKTATESNVAPDGTPLTYPNAFESWIDPVTGEPIAKPEPRTEIPAPKKAKGEPKGWLPKHVVLQIKDGNFAALAQYLKSSMRNKLQREIAKHIFSVVPLKTKIKFVDTLAKGRLAEYDPKTDTIYVTSEGLKDEVMLHEVTHAATVHVINEYSKYLKGQKANLTQDQIDGLEHLEELMEYARGELGATYPEAFKNLHEFVAYAMSSEDFQEELARLPMNEFRSTMLPEYGDLWSKFVYGIAKVLGWTGKIFTKQGEIKKEVALLEALAAFEQIVAPPPEGGIEIPSLPATVQAPALPTQTPEQLLQDALADVRLKEHGGKTFLRNLFTKRGAEWLVTMFQNERYPLKTAQDRAKRFGILSRFGDTMNNVYDQITTSAGKAVNLFETRVKNATDDVHKAVEAYAQSIGVDPKEALARLHLILEALHEPERRMVKFMLNVPLDDTTKFSVKGINAPAMSAEGWRRFILDQVSKPEDVNAAQLGKLLKQIALDSKFHDKLLAADPKNAARFDMNSPEYNVIAGRSPYELKTFLMSLVDGTDPQRAQLVHSRDVNDIPDTESGRALKELIKSLDRVKEATKELNQEANYYSKPVQNVIDLYGFKNYVPFKGKPGTELINEEFNVESRYIGGEMQEAQNSFEGRLSESENPVLQILADGATSAMRAGRKDLMKSIENAVKDKILRGEILPETIKFEDRFVHGTTKADIGGPNKIFIYQPDGSIKIVKITELKQQEALRRSYRMTQPLIEYANMATSALGQMHTRYNPAFAPMNFVRDALTNAFTLGAELGPEKAGKLLTAIAADVSGGGLNKAFKFARLHSNGKFDQIEELAKKDPYFRDMLDYVEAGGKVSYLQGVAAKGALDELIKEVGRSGIMKRKDQVDKFVDIWNEMFELSSRTAAYRLLRDEFYAENKKNKMSDADAMADARAHAVEYAKNLANFEQVGRWGKGMGALYMFFRPAATGAVRAIEALAPAFRLLPPGMGGFDEKAFREQAKAEGRTPEQTDRAVQQMMQEAQYAAHMSFALLGVGATVYLMALLMAGDDDNGRNKVATDDMARWTRYARFHIPGTDFILQIPWGFGLGSFASAGAQMASLLTGRQSFGEIASNIIDTGMDSFLPLPISRISAADNPAAKVMDTVTPSMMRPFFEYVMNLDGLGREIYNNRQTRYGDAYTGGDNIPEMYKATARWLFNATDGAIDWSPNTMYFFANNYADGLAKVAAASTDTLMLATGQKAFDEGAAKSMPFVSSFIGSKSNYDAREFSKFENRIKGMDKRIEALKNQPDKFAAYIEAHPEEYALVDTYNRQVNGSLRQLRASANQIRANPELSPKERKEQLKEIVEMQNMVKRNLLEVFQQIEESY